MSVEIKCDPNCRLLETRPTSDYEDYYVGIAAYCLAVKPPRYLTETGTGVITNSGVKYSQPEPGQRLEDRLAKTSCTIPNLKRLGKI